MDADPQSDLPELEAAIDEYIDWAESEALDDCLLPLPAARARMLQSIGDRIGGFEIERRLGAGGMGLVFLARQLSVDRRWVALKVLRTSFAEESVAERFRREVRALAALDHESIVPVLAADLESDPPFYAMPYVEGASASQLLRELRAAGELPPTMQALRTIVTQDKQEEPSTPSTEHWEETYHRWLARIFIQLAGALEHAHERGVLHRDVKPGNVMITPAGRAVLLDFGLASRTGDESLTVTGAFLGTLAYASPEQAAGEEGGVAADVYSLGSTLYHFLTLHQPFEAADRRELAHRIDHEEPDSVGTEVPVGLRNICRCAMAKSPQHRYASAGAMAHDLEAYLHGAPLQARAPGAMAWVRAQARKHPRVATGLVVFVLLLSSVTVRAFFMAGAKVQEGREVLNRVVDDASELELRRSELASLLEAKRQGAEFDLGRIGGLRDQFQARRQQLESDMDLTESTLRRSFDHIGGYSRARRAIAELYAQRIHLAMAESSDVVMGSEFARLERGLVEFDDDGTHAAMLLTTGWARLNCVQPGATVHVWADGEPEGVRQENPLPFLFEGQEEGSYFARFQAPGFADVLLHFLIRRDAVYDAGESMPPREREVELFRKQEVPNGWVVIPGGYGLYGEDPTRWKWVGTTIMKELEVTLGEWIEWLNKLLEPSSESWHVLARAMTVGGQGAHLPRYGDGSGNLMIELDEASGRWVPRGSSPHVLQEPVCGLTIYDMKDYVRCAVLAGESVPEGWYVDMPSVHEWRRAARGADGRRFVWGDKFDAAKLAGANTMGLLDPVQTRFHQLAVGAVAADTSPFGVRDMSGSKIEATNHTFGRVRGEWAFCGGSSKSYRPEDVSVMQVTGKPSRPYWDAGLRLVMRRLDPVFVEDFMQGTTFSDDFERSSGDSVGNGWWEGTHYPHGIDGDPNAFELCRIQNGELLVTGRAGNSSQPSLAIHRLPGPSSAFELELVMGVQWQSDCARTPGFGLMEEPGATGSTSCKIGFNSDGCARLQFAEDGVVLADMISKPIAIEGDLHLGLHYADRVLRIEVRNQAGGPTEEIVFTLDKEPRPMGFLVIEGTNLCATTTRVKQLEYRRLR